MQPLYDARTTQGEFSISSLQLSITFVSTAAAVLALWGCFGTLVCSLEYHRGLPAGERLRASVWRSSCFDWTLPGARPQHRVALQWLRL